MVAADETDHRDVVQQAGRHHLLRRPFTTTCRTLQQCMEDPKRSLKSTNLASPASPAVAGRRPSGCAPRLAFISTPALGGELIALGQHMEARR